MDQRPLIAVADATGLYGGAVYRAIRNDPHGRYRVRALVWQAHHPAADALRRSGADVVTVTPEDTNSVLHGLRGALALFAVTDFWAHGSPERELAQARAMATAAHLGDLEHVIWSTQEDTRRLVDPGDDRRPTLLQRYKVPPFDAKGEADALFAATGIPVTLLRSALPWEQQLALGWGPRRDDRDATLRLALPMGERPLPGIAAADFGAAVRELFARGTPPAPQTIGIAAEHPTGAMLAAAYANALGESVTYEAVPLARWRDSALPGAEEQASMFQFMHDWSEPYRRHRPVETTRALLPSLLSFRKWLGRHRAEIPAI
jgi:uncharacterized protein YbjT (DUF2867 family)